MTETEVVEREPIEVLADRLGFHDLMPSQIRAWRRDLYDALDAEDLCGRCPGISACPWKGFRPSGYLESDGMEVALVVRYVQCDSSAAVHAESAERKRWAESGIPERFREASLVNYRTQGMHQDCRKLKAEVLEALHDGHSLVLASGNKGNGKTHLAVAFARELLQAGRAVRFWPVKDLLDEARRVFDGKVTGDPLGEAQEVDVLVLDDFGMERPTAWAVERLSGLINHRYNHQLQTLITTNVPHPRDLSDLMGEQGERIASRLKEMAYWVVSEAPDFRSRGRQKRIEA